VALDADGNLWVADNQNNRVLRFPRGVATGLPGHVADLVLGQPDFNSWAPGGALDRMHAPAAVRVDSSGDVYVADSLNGRILVFERPLSSGMSATRALDSGLRLPTGLEFDPGTGGIWVSDRFNNQLLLFVDGQVTKVLFKDVEDDGGTCGGSSLGDGPNFFSPGDNALVASYNVCDSAGSIGIDADGNVLVAGSSFVQDCGASRHRFRIRGRGLPTRRTRASSRPTSSRRTTRLASPASTRRAVSQSHGTS
jgi:DNA-binding beta-propeller fold protein YncE